MAAFSAAAVLGFCSVRAERPAFQPRVSGPGGGQPDPGAPAVAGRQPGQLARPRVTGKPRGGEAAVGGTGVLQNSPFAPAVGAGRQVVAQYGEDLLLGVGEVRIEQPGQAAHRKPQARAVAGPPQPLARDVLWLFLTGVRGLAAVALDDWPRAESAYQDLLPYADRPAGADNTVLTLGPAAQILGDIARHFGRAGAEGHYEQALAVAERAGVGVVAGSRTARSGRAAGSDHSAPAERSRVSAPPGTRTPNPQIKSLLLCQLS
jgi:hypothetical protein